MRKACLFLLIVLYIPFMTTGCSLSQLCNSRDDIADTLGIDLSSSTILQSMDSHGGFHGDGDTYIKMAFPDDESKVLVEGIENNKGWKKLPLTDNLYIAVYGEKSESGMFGPLVKDENGDRYFPWISNGYYFFLDRHSESTDEKDDTELFNRMSFNFTIAIYDIDNNTLHYYKLDT